MPARDPTAAERQRRSKALRDQGGCVVSVRLTRDRLEALIAFMKPDTSKADAVRDDERLRSRLYAEACGEAIERYLEELRDAVANPRSRVTLRPLDLD